MTLMAVSTRCFVMTWGSPCSSTLLALSTSAMPISETDEAYRGSAESASSSKLTTGSMSTGTALEGVPIGNG